MIEMAYLIGGMRLVVPELAVATIVLHHLAAGCVTDCHLQPPYDQPSDTPGDLS